MIRNILSRAILAGALGFPLAARALPLSQPTKTRSPAVAASG